MARKKSPPKKKAVSKKEKEFYDEFLKQEKQYGKKKQAPKKSAGPKTGSRSPGTTRTNTREKSKSAAKKSAKPRKQNITAQIVKRYTDKNGVLRLRNLEGKIVNAETQEAILKAARALDQNNVPFTYEELLEVPQIADLMLVIEDKTPNDLFYWNALSLVEADNKNTIVGPLTKKYVIHTLGGEIIETNSNDRAVFLMMQDNAVLEVAEELIIEATGENPYLTIEVKFTRNIHDDILKIEIDYTRIGGRIPADEIEEYVTRAYNGEKPKAKRKAAVKKDGATTGGNKAPEKTGAKKSNSPGSKKRSGGKGSKRGGKK